MEQVSTIGDKINALDTQIQTFDKEIEYTLLITPNLLHESVPIGKDENDNPVIRTYLEPRKFQFEPLAHYQLAEKLGILDFERAAKITGSRFAIYQGLGARLERALISFMMDVHSKNGYQEIIPPLLIGRV